MKKMIKLKHMLALLLIIGVIVLMNINRTWTFNPEKNLNEVSELQFEQNLNKTSALDLKKNLNVEYFINDIDSDTTFEDLERDIGHPSGMWGSGVSILYYNVGDLIISEDMSTVFSEDARIRILIIRDKDRKYKCKLVYKTPDTSNTQDIKKIFEEKEDINSVYKKEIDISQLFNLNNKYAYKDIVNLYGEPNGIIDCNRIFYHINSYYIFFPMKFLPDSKVYLKYILIYNENGDFKCSVYYDN